MWCKTHLPAKMVVVRAGQGRAGQGRAGQGRAGRGRAGQVGKEMAGQGRAGQGRAGQGRAGQGRAGQGSLTSASHGSHAVLHELEGQPLHQPYAENSPSSAMNTAATTEDMTKQ